MGLVPDRGGLGLLKLICTVAATLCALIVAAAESIGEVTDKADK